MAQEPTDEEIDAFLEHLRSRKPGFRLPSRDAVRRAWRELDVEKEEDHGVVEEREDR